MNTFATIQNENLPQVNQKPVFSQPSQSKMAEQKMEMIATDEIKPCKLVCNQDSTELVLQSISTDAESSSEVDCRWEKFEAEESEDIEEKIIEINAIAPVSKGLWRSIRKSSKTVYIEEVEEASKEEEVEVEAEAEESVDEEDLEEAIAEMNQLIKGQNTSKASKYQQIIRESAEFSQEDLSANGENYQTLKNEVIRILRQKIDMKNYKNTIKQCKKTAEAANEDWYLGDSRKPLKNALKKVRKMNWTFMKSLYMSIKLTLYYYINWPKTNNYANNHLSVSFNNSNSYISYTFSTDRSSYDKLYILRKYWLNILY